MRRNGTIFRRLGINFRSVMCYSEKLERQRIHVLRKTTQHYQLSVTDWRYCYIPRTYRKTQSTFKLPHFLVGHGVCCSDHRRNGCSIINVYNYDNRFKFAKSLRRLRRRPVMHYAGNTFNGIVSRLHTDIAVFPSYRKYRFRASLESPPLRRDCKQRPTHRMAHAPARAIYCINIDDEKPAG